MCALTGGDSPLLEHSGQRSPTLAESSDREPVGRPFPGITLRQKQAILPDQLLYAWAECQTVSIGQRHMTLGPCVLFLRMQIKGLQI